MRTNAKTGTTRLDPTGIAVPLARHASLRQNFAWTIIGNIIYAFCQWGILVLMAKIGSQEMVGGFVLGLAIAAPLIAFSGFQLRALQTTDARNNYTFKDYFSLRFYATLAALTITPLITIFLNYSFETKMTVILVTIAKGFESLSDIFHGLLQKHEQMFWSAISLVLKGSVSVLLVGICVYLTKSVVVAAGVYSVVAGAIFFADVGVARRSVGLGSEDGLGLSRARLWPLLKLSLPLTYVNVIAVLNINIPRYFIEAKAGLRDLGAFAALTYLISNLYFAQTALGTATMPRLAKYFAGGDYQGFSRLSAFVLASGVAFGLLTLIIAFFFGDQVLTWIYTKEYATYSGLFSWLALGSLFQCISGAMSFLLNTMRCFFETAIISTLSGLTLLVLSIILIPAWGVYGAAWAALGSAISATIIATAVFAYKYPGSRSYASRS